MRRRFRLPTAFKLIVLLGLLLTMPLWLNEGLHLSRQLQGMLHSGGSGNGVIAPLFTRTVQHWSDDIERWSTTYSLDPNLLATVMQIESCGHPNVASSAGAQGLFQVMPFHFAPGEVYLDPDTNAMRGANFLNECLGYADGDVGLALACYNGGPSVVRRNFHTWAHETQRYYLWGVGIYSEARRDSYESTTLSEWLNAGGVNLCNRAAVELGISSMIPVAGD